VRIRIVKRTVGILDGQSIKAFVPGDIFDVEEHSALQFVEMGGAIDAPITPRFPPESAGDTHSINGGVHIIRRERRKKERRSVRKKPK
jgi:ribosomal protein S12